MRSIRRILLTAVVITASPAFSWAQTTGTGSIGTGTSTGGLNLGTSGLSTSGISSSGTSSLTSGNSGSSGSLPSQSSLDNTQGSMITASTVINSSNVLGKYYANPYYQGRAGAVTGENPGGFGASLYGTAGVGGSPGSTTGTTGTTGRTGTTGTTTFPGLSSTGTGTTGRTGTTGFGNTGATGFGNTGRAGGTGTTGTTQGGGQIIPLPQQISYTAVVNFRTPQLTPAKMQSDVRAAIDRSTMIANPRGIEVVSEAGFVLLRGSVKDEDEARLVEGMVRLTPGVRDVRNELKFPTP